MLKKIFLKIFGIMFAFGFVLLCININYSAIFDLPNSVRMTLEDLNSLNQESTFGRYATAELSENIFTVGGERRHNTSLLIKLFGIIPIKRVDAVIEDDKEVYLGGIPLGFSINTKGLIVVGENRVSGNSKAKSPFKTGDIITKINNQKIEKPNDIYSMLEGVTNEPLSVSIIRKGEEREIVVLPQYDEINQEYKIGLWVRDDAQGIGTLTFVTKDGKFGALGHSICDYETGVEIPVQDGGVYLCNLVGINKAEKGKTGEIRCLFSQTKEPNGDILKNTKCGVFGISEDVQSLIDSNLIAPVGNRMLVKLGRAKIISSVSGIREEYDIEIIKANFQPKSSDKSFVFRVIDSRLIDLTGGIVQGMSGSPILQNGKIIGAVTHVFLNDATKGYGVYIDWMLEQAA
ncbi:MAG: SpoIVB peptidase [Clostridiales bacterium]|nr:SpoIVB peptidase [Clostridiales bacterium]